MSSRGFVNAMLFGGQHEAIIERIDALTEERDVARRLFNRIEAAISHHKSATATFTTDADDALYAARDRILRDSASPSNAQQEADRG